MCGICVVVSDVGAVEAELVHGMCERMVHRGPDSEGLHLDGRVGLGMRRLSVIDLPGGQQPIFNEDRSMAIVFNGEIYNYRELRDDLVARGHTFATSSDTESILHAYEEYGEAAVARLRGMFAFAIHERKSGRVFLARDRLGIKPLHWAEIGGRFYAARELKNLPPGHLLVKDPGKPAAVRRYWQLHSRPDRTRSEADWITDIRRGLDDAVASHLVADVPLGVFLSGGVDSSALVAAMSRTAAGRIKTFSVGFPSEYAAFDERPFARQVATRFDTDHQEMEVAPDVGEAMLSLGRIFDEPMGDSGAVPNLLVCRMARQHLTVALSGLGGDELAGGYQRYLGVTLAEWYRKIPAFLRNDVVRRLVDLIPESRSGARGIDQAKRFVRSSELPYVERFFAFSSPLERSRREALYQPELRARVALDSAQERMQALGAEQPDADLLNKILCIDQQTYLVDDLLTVADRTSMAVSLEVRVPFLDHPFVELMAGVPGNLKIRGGKKKYLLKRALETDLPPEILARKKAGFSLPLGRWLREDLRGMVDELLAPQRLRQQGWFAPSVVETLKAEHLARRRNNSTVLWALMMFQLWAREWYQ